MSTGVTDHIPADLEDPETILREAARTVGGTPRNVSRPTWLTPAGSAVRSTGTGFVAFLAVGVAGLAGAVAAGRLADRHGRTALTRAPAAAWPPRSCSPAAAPVLVRLLIVWGAAVIADSAQFSAAVTELAEPPYAWSVLALQLALGFALTIVTIRLVPLAADLVGWRYALLPLAVGPLLGALAMLRLRLLPAALGLAGGRR